MLLGLLRAPYAAQRNYTAQIVEQAITEYLIKEHSRLDTRAIMVSSSSCIVSCKFQSNSPQQE